MDLQLGLFDEPTPRSSARSGRQAKVASTAAETSPAAQVERTIADISRRANLLGRSYQATLDPVACVAEVALKTRPETFRAWVLELALGADGDTAAVRFCNHILTGVASTRPDVGDRRAALALPWVPLFLVCRESKSAWERREVRATRRLVPPAKLHKVSLKGS